MPGVAWIQWSERHLIESSKRPTMEPMAAPPSPSPDGPGTAELAGVADSNQDSIGRIDPPNRSRLALVASFSLHFIVILTLGLLSTRPSAGTGEAPDRPIGIAMVHRRPDRDRYVEAESIADETSDRNPSPSETASVASAAAAMPPGAAPPIDLAAALATMTAPATPGVADGPAGSQSMSGDGDVGIAKGGSGPVADDASATTSVFGVSGSGSSFVYVFDRSDSMNGFGGRPLRAAKRELIKSLESLTDRQRFSLVFYNDRPTPFAPSGAPFAMIPGDEAMVTTARRYINSVQAYGGTEHGDALRMALRLGPDVIFFLTDASVPRLSSSQLRVIRSRAQTSGTVIHAIEFGTTPAAAPDSFLKELASAGGGQYRYVNVQRLP